uniref:TRI27 protein n=1 Tax=Junco hyemalis TaxID=40217 RepID=A0A8C5J168_JUNHY
MENRDDDPCPSSSSGSAAPPSSAPGLREELQCPVCYEPFREAVTLPCGHNFCKGCISRSWEQRRPECPLCKERSSLEQLRVNHTLRNLVELVLKEEGQRQGRGVALCPAHQEEPKFFCMEDKELACFSCQSSKEHQGHKMRPVQEAAADFRAESERLERQVKWEFEKLHKFLWDEEQAVLAQIREEAGRKQDLIQGKMEQLSEASQALLAEAARLQADSGGCSLRIAPGCGQIPGITPVQRVEEDVGHHHGRLGSGNVGNGVFQGVEKWEMHSQWRHIFP